MSIMGNIHSIETCGTVDGPGIRFVIFMQGCPMRCAYCHNPDTWAFDDNKLYSTNDILTKYFQVKEFCKGGITVTGGEPLAQIEFVTELFENAQQNNIHTALDTSGIYFNEQNFNKIEKLLDFTNLVILDIKHINNDEHIKLTNHPNENVLSFAKHLSNRNIPVWMRHVIVPEITYNEKYLKELGEFLSTLKNIKALDVLPYHNMAIPKYDALGIDYKLKGIPPLTKEQAVDARNTIIKAIKNSKTK